MPREDFMDPERLLLSPMMLYATPADVIDDASLDNETKRLLLRRWRHDAVKVVDPCRARGALLIQILEALKLLEERI
jgi:hypothetical protein